MAKNEESTLGTLYKVTMSFVLFNVDMLKGSLNANGRQQAATIILDISEELLPLPPTSRQKQSQNLGKLGRPDLVAHSVVRSTLMSLLLEGY